MNYHPNVGSDSLRDALLATLGGNHRESSGESRFTAISQLSAIHISMLGLPTNYFETSSYLYRIAQVRFQ